MPRKKKFGDFILEKRKARGISARELSKILGFSPVYMCDLEKNRKFAISDEALEKIIEVLALTESEAEQMYDLVAIARNTVSPDLPQYIMENPLIRTALREAKKNKLPDERWEQFIREISRKE
jgi:transcriptional regulator with XRE-family HTH domain